LVLFDPGSEYLFKLPFIQEAQPRIYNQVTIISYDTTNDRKGEGVAVDFKCLDNQTRQKIVKAAHECGVVRMGIGRTFIHVDMGERVGLRPAIWVYDDNGNAV
jgi:hypothetical protein